MSSRELTVQDARLLRRIRSPCRPYWIRPDNKADEPLFDRFAPPPTLRRSIAYLWALDCRNSQRPAVELVPPDAGIELIYRLGGAGEMLVRGPQRRLTTVSIDPLANYVGVRMPVAVAQRLTGLSTTELVDHRLPAAPINSELSDRLHDAGSGHSKQHILMALAAFLSQLLGESESAHLDMTSAAIRLIERSNGAVPVHEIARRMGCSERHLRRVLVAMTGLSPREHVRIARFRSAIHLVARTSASLAGIAIDLAYTDQPHMTREFVTLAGRTPRSLRRLMSAFAKNSSPQSQ